MLRRLKFIFVFGVIPIVCGCSQEQDPLDKIVYVTIDGMPLTASFVRDSVLISLRISEANGHSPKPSQFAHAANGLAAKIIPQLVSARMMEKYMSEKGVKPSDEIISRTLSNYNRKLKSDYRDLESMAASFGEQRKAFISQFNREVCLRELEKELKLNVVTAADRISYYRDTSNQVMRAQLIDKKAHEAAAKAYARLQAGEEWGKVAQEASEDKLLDEAGAQYWKTWEEIPATGYVYPEVLAALQGVPVGGYTKPFESEMGLLIVRVNSEANGVKSCSRILFRLAVPVTFVQENKLDEHIRREKIRMGHKRILDEVWERTKFEYPQGENFKVTIWPMSK